MGYTMCCGCGFPSITLTGTPEDWKKIRAKAASFSKYDLDWWLKGLLPVLDQFVAAARGNPDVDFWRSLCMIDTGGSDPEYEALTGWAQVFFPYLVAGPAYVRNAVIENYLESFQKKINITNVGRIDSESIVLR